jgi:HK97 gp10 family phage protein
MAFKPQIRGLDKTISDLKKFGNKAEEALNTALETTAYDMVDKAVSLVVVDTGKLKQSIRVVTVSESNFIVEAGGGVAPYAPYIEFGTGGLVDVPKEFDEQARRALGKGIKQVNLPPRPYMYPAYLYGLKEIEKNLKIEIEQLTKATK